MATIVSNMAALVKIAKFSAQLASRKPAALFTAVRQHSNKDWKPGPYPRTEEERVAAAKKYGIHPDKYEPYPDDGMGYGDYPKLPMVSTDSRDPFYPWDIPALKRNFNEPMHAHELLINDTRYDISYKHRIPISTQWLTFFGVMGGCYMLYFYLEDKHIYQPVLGKQLPGDGSNHYTFEKSSRH